MAGSFFGSRLPSSFLPDEDQGYIFVNMQLPNAASLERTDAAAGEVEKILAATPGRRVHHQRGWLQPAQLRPDQLQRLLLCHSEALGRPQDRGGTVSGNQGALEPATQPAAGKGLSSVSRRRRYPASAPPGGFTFVLEDRAGRDVQFLADNLAKFLAAARKRPEIGLIAPRFCRACRKSS